MKTMGKKFLPTGTLLMVALILSATSAAAQMSGSTKVQGNSSIDVHADRVDTIASGSKNAAITSIGTIDSSLSAGRQISVDVQGVENIVTGTGRKGCITIGSTTPCK